MARVCPLRISRPIHSQATKAAKKSRRDIDTGGMSHEELVGRHREHCACFQELAAMRVHPLQLALQQQMLAASAARAYDAGEDDGGAV